MKKSITENTNYSKVCEMASNNDYIFSIFKSIEAYVDVLEHVTFEQGKKYLEIIQDAPEFSKFIEKFRKNDMFGSPKTFEYGKFGKFSPTTLRYIKVMLDLKNIHGDLTGMDILEIGCGYGGQAKIICDTFNVKSYTFVDLPETIMLVKKYLSKFSLNNEVNVISYGKNLDLKEKYDLCISNYAFTECDKEVQQNYIDKFINNSNKGYITCNFVSKEIANIESFSLEELKNNIKKDISILPEKPLTHQKNCIMVW